MSSLGDRNSTGPGAIATSARASDAAAAAPASSEVATSSPAPSAMTIRPPSSPPRCETNRPSALVDSAATRTPATRPFSSRTEAAMGTTGRRSGPKASTPPTRTLVLSSAARKRPRLERSWPTASGHGTQARTTPAASWTRTWSNWVKLARRFESTRVTSGQSARPISARSFGRPGASRTTLSASDTYWANARATTVAIRRSADCTAALIP